MAAIRKITGSTKLRVIINGVVLEDVTLTKLDKLLGNTYQRAAVHMVADEFNASVKASTGLLSSVRDIQVQIDLR